MPNHIGPYDGPRKDEPLPKKVKWVLWGIVISVVATGVVLRFGGF